MISLINAGLTDWILQQRLLESRVNDTIVKIIKNVLEKVEDKPTKRI